MLHYPPVPLPPTPSYEISNFVDSVISQPTPGMRFSYLWIGIRIFEDSVICPPTPSYEILVDFVISPPPQFPGDGLTTIMRCSDDAVM